MRKLLLAFALLPQLAFAADLNLQEWKMVPRPFAGSNGSFENLVIDGTADLVSCVLPCAKACTIDSLCFRRGSASGTPVVHRISLQGVDATNGRPDGTIKSSTNARGTFTPTASDNSKFLCTSISSSYACTQGEIMSIVVGDDPVDGGSPAGGTSMSFTYGNDNALGTLYPYGYTFDGSTHSLRNRTQFCGYKCGSDLYAPAPLQDWSTTTWGSDSTPDERGNHFTIPTTQCSTFQVGGVRVFGRSTASSSFKAIIYDGTTNRQEVTIDGDQLSGSAAYNWMDIAFSGTLYTFSGGSQYRVVLAPQNTSGTPVGMSYVTLTDAADRAGLPMGTNAGSSSRTDAGAWTDDNTRLYSMSLLIKDCTVSASGGGSDKNQGINGGLNK